MLDVNVRRAVTMPTDRVQLALTFGKQPGTGSSEFFRQVTKYQSFGMATVQEFWGKLLAAHVDYNNPCSRHVLLAAFGADPLGTARDAAGAFATMAIATTALKEALGFLSPRRKKLLDSSQFAGVNWEDNGLDFIRYSLESLGTISILSDMVVSSLENGTVSASLFPLISNELRNLYKIKRAAFSKSTEGERAKAVSAALAQNIVGYTGIDRHPLTQAFWFSTMGDYLDQWALGDDAYRKKRKRQQRAGYIDSPTSEFFDWVMQGR